MWSLPMDTIDSLSKVLGKLFLNDTCVSSPFIFLTIKSTFS